MPESTACWTSWRGAGNDVPELDSMIAEWESVVRGPMGIGTFDVEGASRIRCRLEAARNLTLARSVAIERGIDVIRIIGKRAPLAGALAIAEALEIVWGVPE
jgi:hypothetical protein